MMVCPDKKIVIDSHLNLELDEIDSFLKEDLQQLDDLLITKDIDLSCPAIDTDVK